MHQFFKGKYHIEILDANNIRIWLLKGKFELVADEFDTEVDVEIIIAWFTSVPNIPVAR
ncbi:MAG: hypothetical protein GX275_05030 [Clostridiales bacterium]|nr:hypothetical protein [Clostridiales bacterium]